MMTFNRHIFSSENEKSDLKTDSDRSFKIDDLKLPSVADPITVQIFYDQ